MHCAPSATWSQLLLLAGHSVYTDMQATKRCSESEKQSQELFGLPAFGPGVSALETVLATGNMGATESSARL